MKHTVAEMQFAATVRDLVLMKRKTAMADMSDEEADAYLKLPIDGLVREALEELDRIAAVISREVGRQPLPPAV